MKIWELLDKEEKWTKGAYARTATGDSTGYLDPNAVSWDLYAASAFCYDEDEVTWDRALDKLSRQIEQKHPHFISLFEYNDRLCKSYEELISVCKAANV